MNGLGGGYVGRVLNVDLGSGSIETSLVDAGMARRFIGGTGYGAAVLWNEVSQGIGPLDPGNLLLISTGPVTGTSAPGSGNFAVITRSPLTGFACAAQANGHFGPTLKRAGFDFVTIRGKSERWTYLFIEDGNASIHDADWLHGKTTFETEDALSRMHEGARVLCIGPAGENMVRYASIVCDRGHVMASGGPGAVMGSKRLKAIVVKGTGSVPVFDRSRLSDISKEWIEDARNSGFGKVVDALGTTGLFASYHKQGWVPVRNLTTNKFDEFEMFDGTYIRQRFPGKRARCWACPFDHCRMITINGPDGPLEVEEPEYEDFAAWGPNIGNADPEAAVYLTYLTDALGLDTKEATFTVSLLMECFEKALIKEQDLDGIRLDWGNTAGVANLLRRIAYGQGIGSQLTGGVYQVARWIGGEAPNYAVHVKRGNAPHVHDCRTRWGTIFTQAISNMASQEGIDLTGRGARDLGIPGPVGFSEKGIPEAQAKSGPKRQFEDSLAVCYFLCRGDKGLEVMAEALNAATGFDLTPDDALTVGRRIINLLRLFNIRHGHSKDDDSVSPRLLEPPNDGPGAGKSLAGYFENMRATYYEAMGWDEDGRPKPETLKALGLEVMV